jgi:hypothetical protein
MTHAIVHDVERAARAAPAAPALSWRGAVWTYGELQGAIKCVKSRLAAEGLAAGAIFPFSWHTAHSIRYCRSVWASNPG